MRNSLIFLVFLITFSPELFAQEYVPPTILQADQIDGDKVTNIINASGNVEISRGKDILYSDKITYDKNKKMINAKGNIEVKGDKIGNIYAKEINIKDDFSNGNLTEGKIIFNDGSYVTSPYIDRQSKTKSILQHSLFSFCPNSEILADQNKTNNDIGFITLKSDKTIIDKDDGTAKVKNGVLRISKVPIFYTPYLSFPLRSASRKSGFLHPSYTNTDNLGFGLKIPYYFNIAPNKDLVTTTQYHPSGKHIIINNYYRHLTKKGKYDIEAEVANNNLTATADYSPQRWLLRSKSDFSFSNNIGLETNIDYVGDKHYLRDYHNDFTGHTVSEINLDQIKNNNYTSIKAVKIQELEVNINSREEVNALPVINSYFESKPGKLNETYSILTNSTIITRRSGLEYRRLSFKPEFIIPYNISGNILTLSTAVQGDIYNLDDNYTSTTKVTEYDHGEVDYRPELSLSWNLPLIKKTADYSFVIDPKVNFITSSYSKNYNNIPNEDSNDTELTQSNLFLKDRFVGFDRNESGERINYGFTSNLFNSFGQFGFGLGQGYRENNKSQDVTIKGFNNSNKSNIVGEVSYKSPKIFEITYNFQLNESNYSNDVNEVNTDLTFDSFNIYSNYILIHNNPNTNSESREQLALGINTKIYGGLRGYFDATKDFVSDRIISRRIGIDYNGCCVSYGFSVSQNNPSNLTESEKSYNLNFTIKNL